MATGHELAVIQPRSLEETISLGKVLASSGYFSDAREAAQAVVKIMAGAELGIPAIAAMRGVYIVKNQVSFGAALIATMIKKSGKYNYRVRVHDDNACEIEFFEDGQPAGVSRFDMEDARQAGLATNDNYKKFPRNMLWSRAMSNGAKWYCAEIFGGAVYTPDELGATVDAEGEVLSLPASEVRVVAETGEIIDQPKAAKPVKAETIEQSHEWYPEEALPAGLEWPEESENAKEERRALIWRIWQNKGKYTLAQFNKRAQREQAADFRVASLTLLRQIDAGLESDQRG